MLARVERLADKGRSTLPAVRPLAWLLVQPVSALDARGKAILARVEQDEEADAVAALARQFAALIRRCGVTRRCEPAAAEADLHGWLAAARVCGIAALVTFAAGLEADGPAVRAAMTLPWSSGQAEGQITKLKLIKRQMYGRAGFDLLRRRVLLAS